MKITKVEVHLLEKKLSNGMRISRGGFSVRKHAIFQVHTSEGITGFGEGVGDANSIASSLIPELADSFIGKSPLKIQKLLQEITRETVYFSGMGSFLSVLSAIEMACMDIQAQYYGMSISGLLGGQVFDELEVYASDIYWDKDPYRMAEEALRIKNLGINVIKAHIGVESPSMELVRIEKIREYIGHETKLMLDINAGYTLPQAMEAFKMWKRFDPYWIEEPLMPDSRNALKTLKNNTDIMIAQGENMSSMLSYKDVLDSGSVQILMPDLGRVGGIMATARICNIASAYGVSVSPHNFSSGILLNSTVQLMSSQNNAFLLEIDTSDNAIYEELLSKPIKVFNGKVQVSDISIDNERVYEAIQKYKIN